MNTCITVILKIGAECGIELEKLFGIPIIFIIPITEVKLNKIFLANEDIKKTE